jgi:sulfite dehydrogenase
MPGLSGCAMGSGPRPCGGGGGGFGGATVAKYLRMWSQMGVDVTLVERNPQFISCPISNLVIGGDKRWPTSP